MTSAVKPIFDEKVAENWNLWVPWTVHGTHWFVENGWKVKIFGYCSCTVAGIQTGTQRSKGGLDTRCVCASAFPAFSSFFFFFPSCSTYLKGQQLLFMYCSWIVAATFDYFNLQISLFSHFFIKNGSYGTIHTFKIYFATVFSVFSFSKISFYPIKPLVCI